MSVYQSVSHWLDQYEAETEIAKVRASLARQLALKLDEAVADTTAGSAQATPGISKELRAVMDDIREAEGAKEEFVAGIFSE